MTPKDSKTLKDLLPKVYGYHCDSQILPPAAPLVLFPSRPYCLLAGSEDVHTIFVLLDV